MRRISVLLTLLVVYFWLQTDVGSSILGAARLGWLNPAVSAQECCDAGQSSPHYECGWGYCVSVQGCGVDQCTPGNPYSCILCDPYEEWLCYWEGGIWNSYLCLCQFDPGGCDPQDEYYCYLEGGDWDPVTCTCGFTGFCLPGPVEVVGSGSYSDPECTWCNGVGQWCRTCTYYWTEYAIYCQDGSLYDSWTEEERFCDMSDDDFANCP